VVLSSLLINTQKERLGGLFGYESSVLFGRARSAIVALLEVLGADKDFSFIIPSNLSPVVYIAGRSCGVNILLCPVDSQTGLLSDEVMAEMVRNGGARGMVMPTYLYGYYTDYPATIQAAGEKGWFVLENDTMATKVQNKSNPPKLTSSDGLLISFSDGKAVEAGGGGAILVKDKKLAGELQSRAASYPVLDSLANQREHWFLALRLHLRKGPPGGPSMASLSENTLKLEEKNLKYAFPETLTEPLSIGIDHVWESLRSRKEKAALWRDKLEGVCGIEFPPLAQPSPWRFICRIPKNRDSVAHALRAEGIDAGINYPPLTDSFPYLLKNQTHVDADLWASDVINLWLTEDYDEARIDKAISVMRGVLRD